MTAQGNRAPNAPVINEPTAPNVVVNPNDVHMETAPFIDPDPGDVHAASDWEIWTVTPSQRVWAATGVTGPEKIHIHLGDGRFENSHAGWRRLFASTQFTLRVRHRDDSGDPATEKSAWSSIPFRTDVASVKSPLDLDDVLSAPAPTWRGPGGVDIDLPFGTPPPALRLETDAGWMLLRAEADAGPGNRWTNPPPLPTHGPVRVVIDAGNSGRNLVLPETELAILEIGCRGSSIRLPAVNLPPGSRAMFWVSAEGATYLGNVSPSVPSFQFPARGLSPPWVPRAPGFVVDVVATGLRLPVNIAFAPSAGGRPSDPAFYVSELYGTIAVVANDGTLSTYASGMLNYTPPSQFPGNGEQGLTGIAVDPVSGDVLASHLWRNSQDGMTYGRISRLQSTDGGRTAATRSVILDMQGEPQSSSHQISRLEIVGGELYCHMGDGFASGAALDLDSYRGKILRLNLDGSPIASNPFYNGGTRDARDYIYAYGMRNPFGGAWRAADGLRYVVENGPSIDRFAQVTAGLSLGWDGTNVSMRIGALHTWEPSTGPVNLAFVQSQTFAGSGFPPRMMDHAFVTESGPTYAQGQQAGGKRITEFVLDAAGRLVSGPAPFVEYVGDGFATAVGLAAGPDGLYFTELYKDENSGGPTAVGGRILRVRYGDPEDCNANGLPDSCEIAVGTSPDYDGNGVPDECDPLAASDNAMSLSSGGRIDFVLRAGVVRAGSLYVLVGSMSGTSPGTTLGSVLLPLNVATDPWFELSLTLGNSSFFQNTLGLLDGAGEAAAALALPANLPPNALGLRFDHAFAVIDQASVRITFASNPVPLWMTQ